ncbi:CRISPR-associated protein Cas2 [Candidatus Magnetomorum sp. HK-1]|nr:CRISPR-associated protein Cas2 [Candidatus Magnetomorum sp. HK-1]
MIRNGWYIIAYDISDNKRLKRVHRKLKNEAIAVQKSVFIARGSEHDINYLMDKISLFMDDSKDDLRAYPIVDPKSVWTNGTNPLAQGRNVSYSSKNSHKSMKKTRKKSNKQEVKLVKRIIQYFR